MTVYLVGAGPGRRDLLTLRAFDLLSSAEVVVVDRLVGDEVLGVINPGARIIDVGKRPATDGHGGDESTHQGVINSILVDEGRRAETVVRLKGGDPYLFGRGGEEAEALRDAGVRFEVVPGVSSAFALPSLAGVPVTHRGVSRAVVVVSGHEPVESSSVGWSHLAASGATLVILMGVARRGAIAAELIASGLSQNTPVAAIERGTTPAERTVRTTLGELGSVELSSPAIMIVGPVAGFDFRDLPHASLRGARVGVTGLRERTTALVEQLRARGATVAHTPLIEVTAPSDGGARLRSALAERDALAWIAVTSASGARALVEAVADLRRLDGVGIAAVGPGTRDALTAQNLIADLVGTAGGEALARLLGRPGSDRTKVLQVAARFARPEFADTARSLGWEVEVCEGYQTSPAAISEVARDELLHCSVVVFASPSAVESFLALKGAQAATPVAVAIGETTAEAARAAGWETLVAQRATEEALCDAVVAAVRMLPGPA